MGSDDYSISLPGGPLNQSITTRGRHLSMSSVGSGDERSQSRQSTSTTYSVLDTRHIHLYMKRGDSLHSLNSIITMSQQPEDEAAGTSGFQPANPNENVAESKEEEAGDEEVENGSKKTNVNGKEELNSQMSQMSLTSTRSTPNLSTVVATVAARAASRSPLHHRTRGEAMWRCATHEPEEDNSYPRPRSSYLGELVWQVDDLVFCGGIQAVQNLNLLCRLNIEYIIDLCGEESEAIYRFSRLRPECPCLCSRKTAHSRMTMSISLKDDSDPNVRVELSDQQRADIITYFTDLINIIRKARVGGKCVLIHSMKGRNRAPAFVAAYLMQTQRITRMQALHQVSEMMSKTRPGLAVSDNLQRALMRWQTMLGIRSRDTQDAGGSSATQFQVKRTAWN
ncbi:hypothetical protein M3Y99_00450900 [Aphelenchoides fujianensis]|nr:hypothetical protein M3Y99_00450900 [Aphelenchoides fujianensis]